MTSRSVWLAVLLLAGCGNTGSNGSSGNSFSADPFAGDWQGLLAVTPDGAPTQDFNTLVHVRTFADTLELQGLCGVGHGPTGKANGPSTFVLDHSACAPVQDACGPVTITTESGAGTVAGASLSFALTATVTGCGDSQTYSLGFTGARAAPTDGGPGTDGGADAGTTDGGTPSVAAPVASIRAPSTISPGTVVTLDGSGSFDPGGLPLTYSWTLVAPAGSAAVLQGATSAQATFTADVTGTFTALLTVSNGQKSANATTTITVATGSLTLLGWAPIDVEYDRPMDRLVAISTTPDLVHLLDPVTLDDRTASLPLVGRAVGVSPDGLMAVVGHDAWVSDVDLTTMTVVHTWPITADVGDVVVTDPMQIGTRTTRFAYVFPSRDQWVSIHVIDLGNGAETTAGGVGAVYAGDRALLEPAGSHVFSIDPELSPTQLYRWDVDRSSGALTGPAQSPYWGDYPIGGNFWISDDGTQLLTAGGTRFRAADLTYGGKTSVSYIAWADASSDAGRWVVQPGVLPYGGGTSQDDTVYWTYDTVYLANPQRVDYPKFVRGGTAYDVHGRYVFWNKAGTGIVVLAQVDTAAQISASWTVLRY